MPVSNFALSLSLSKGLRERSRRPFDKLRDTDRICPRALWVPTFAGMTIMEGRHAPRNLAAPPHPG